jgi:hypothetical protein
MREEANIIRGEHGFGTIVLRICKSRSGDRSEIRRWAGTVVRTGPGPAAPDRLGFRPSLNPRRLGPISRNVMRLFLTRQRIMLRAGRLHAGL